MNVMQDFDNSKLYEAFGSGEWWDANQWHSVRDQWYLVAVSYKNAADLLVDQLPDALLLGLERVYIACPIMFLYRHYLELALKALMLDLQALGKQKPVDHNQAAQNFDAKLPGHPLMKSWDPVKNILLAIDDEARTNDAAFTEANAISNTIEEFDKIDGSSMNFRYPVKKQGERILSPLPNAQEMSHVKEIVEEIAGYFGSIETWIHEERRRFWEGL